ncbi:MAG: guanylate kinase [Flavobacteriales bacterium CG_4_9_14_3_um_filter_40_17]|nr:MAG: guanylate kinase [Flavobacteriales bacterium CG_4_9_14_3_um_filter_40_17]
MKQGKLIVFSAPSGSGKTTLVHHLLNQPELKLAFSVSATSREKRPAEVDGKDYYFISNGSFEDKILKNQFIEYEEVYKGTYYGTLKNELERIWALKKNIIFDIDVLGGLNIKRQFPKHTLAVFVRPPSVEELEKRLRNRQTESEGKIKMRLMKATQELETAPLFDVIIENQNLEQAKRDAYRLVKEFIEQ